MARRTDPLVHWRARSFITADEYEAGRRFEKLFEAAALNGHAALDVSRERVDCGIGSASADRKIAARQQIMALRARLGEVDFGLVCRVVGQGQELAGPPDEVRYLRRRIRDALVRLG